MNISLEGHYRIYNDDTGEYITVSTDNDGLDLVQITQDKQRIVLHPAQVAYIILALQRVHKEVTERTPGD